MSLSETTSTAHPSRAKILLAFAVVYLIWGSTYLAIRFSVETIPPLLMAGCRFVMAGAALYLLTRAGGAASPSRRHWAGAWPGGGEALTARGLLASATIIAGVALIITHRPSPVAVTPDTEGLPAERPES